MTEKQPHEMPEATPEEVAVDPVAELAAERDSWKDKYLRQLAEIDNLRKRHAREIDEAHKFAATKFAREMLAVQDSLERAVTELTKLDNETSQHATVQGIRDGVEMTLKQLQGIFGRFDIERIATVGEKFNPDLHQAMFEVPTHEHPEGVVVQEVQSGYKIAGRLLRPAMVGTAKLPADENNKVAG